MAIRSKADPIQITQRTFEEDLDAIRVVMLPTEMEMNLSTESGDSIHAISKMQVIQCEAGDVIQTSEARRICCFPESELKAVLGEVEHSLGVMASLPQEICVPAIKVMSACTVVIQS